MNIVYNLGLHLLVIAAFCRKRSRKHFFERLGKNFPKIEKNGRPLIWVHAVSVGETKAIAPLVKQLKASPKQPLIVFSNVTGTGHEEAKRAIPEADWHVFLPFDLSYLIRPLVKKVAPDLVILTETDFWHHFETAAKESGASIVLANGKLSERSFHRYLQWKPFAKLLLHPVDLFCLQGNLYAERFKQVGIPSEKLIVTGNIKLDGLGAPDASAEWRRKLGLTEDDLILTCGSTHDPEEKILLEALKKAWEQFPNLKAVIVPRHPERFEIVAKLIEQEGIPFSRLSRGEDLSSKRVILIDAMGVLRQCYQISDVAFVGGSLTSKVGGHNIFEPSFYGVPVLYGPYMHSQPDFLELMRAYKAGIQIDQETLFPTLEKLLKHPHKRKELGKSGLKLVHEASGALENTYREIAKLDLLARK